MPDALSRLHPVSDEFSHQSKQLAYPIANVEIGSEFLNQHKSSYNEDPRTKGILDVLNNNDNLESNAVVLPFEIVRGVLYTNPDEIHNLLRPVTTKNLHGDLFHHVHDNLGHIAYDKMHERISNNFYISNLSKHLKARL